MGIVAVGETVMGDVVAVPAGIVSVGETVVGAMVAVSAGVIGVSVTAVPGSMVAVPGSVPGVGVLHAARNAAVIIRSNRRSLTRTSLRFELRQVAMAGSAASPPVYVGTFYNKNARANVILLPIRDLGSPRNLCQV
jgi:hypothetical protein